jgi:hypothetical protein
MLKSNFSDVHSNLNLVERHAITQYSGNFFNAQLSVIIGITLKMYLGIDLNL